MLGDDDHEVIADEPIAANDLFGEVPDLPPLSPLNGEDNNNAVEGEKDSASLPKKRKQVNRLPNLNEAWLTDPRKEGILKVNSYFEKVKFKKGKGTEARNLKLLLQRYEYWAQQCYPRFCFQDFVEKVEGLSGKRLIKNTLQEIRTQNIDNDVDQPQNTDDDNNTAAVGQYESFNFGSQEERHQHTSENEESFTENVIPSPAAKSSELSEDMKELICRKREEAIAKRQKKLEESTLCLPVIENIDGLNKSDNNINNHMDISIPDNETEDLA